MMCRQVLSRVWAAVGARFPPQRRAAGRRAWPIRGHCPDFCLAKSLHRLLKRKPRTRTPPAFARTPGQPGLGTHERQLPACCAPGGAARARKTLISLTQEGCVHRSRSPGVAPGWPRPLPSEIRSRLVIKMFDADPSYFQGMRWCLCP